MTLKTLLLLKRCLQSQQLSVGVPDFPETAMDAVQALKELDEAIGEAK